MPVYDYQCPECGVFTVSRPMSAYRDPCACPDCGKEAARVFLTSPAVGGQDRAGAALSPSKPASHGASCSCCSGMRSLPKRSA